MFCSSKPQSRTEEFKAVPSWRGVVHREPGWMVEELESPRGEGQAYFFFGAFFFLGAFFFGAFLTACTGVMWG